MPFGQKKKQQKKETNRIHGGSGMAATPSEPDRLECAPDLASSVDSSGSEMSAPRKAPSPRWQKISPAPGTSAVVPLKHASIGNISKPATIDGDDKPQDLAIERYVTRQMPTPAMEVETVRRPASRVSRPRSLPSQITESMAMAGLSRVAVDVLVKTTSCVW